MPKPPIRIYDTDSTVSVGITVFLLSPLLLVLYAREAAARFFTGNTVIAILVMALYLVFCAWIIVRTARDKPRMIIDEYGIEEISFYGWEQIHSFALQKKQHDDTSEHFLVLYMVTADTIKINISHLDKTPGQIADIITRYSDGRSVFQGHFFHKEE